MRDENQSDGGEEDRGEGCQDGLLHLEATDDPESRVQAAHRL